MNSRRSRALLCLSPVVNSEFKISEKEIDFLRRRWESLFCEYDADKRDVEDLYHQLVRLYSAEGRAYHNLSHIRSLLDLSDTFRDRIQNYQALGFAVWFHDAIYDTRKKDNEELSAKLAVKSLGRFKVLFDTLVLTCEMILATSEHRNKGDSEDLNLFLDLDLSILGSEEQVYRSYAQAIRKEYWWVPGSLYNAGRKKMLASFLERKSIYLTREMVERFEEQARRNIRREIESLSN
jgi:predicted metal-dependent HD superfamily phosphohydrolase